MLFKLLNVFELDWRELLVIGTLLNAVDCWEGRKKEDEWGSEPVIGVENFCGCCSC